MKSKKAPERTCIGCGEKKDKKDLVRIVRNKDGEIFLDLTGRENGRGAYICKKAKCLDIAEKKHGLDRSFKMSVPKEIFEALREKMEDAYEK